MTDMPRIRRVRHDTLRRNLTIARTERVTPQMLRLTLEGPELEGFVSASPDDHIKIIVPDASGETAMRDYTPRRHLPEARQLEVDFALHDAGPATKWALAAQVGDTATIAGPRGSQIIEGNIERWVLVGDETALPSIARRIEELPAAMPVTSLVAVADAGEEQEIETNADHVALWTHRSDPADPAPLRRLLDRIALPPRTFVWIAAEASVARALRDDLTGRGHPKEWLKAAGYWIAGQADGSAKDL
ncbi:siderophore-interacting protein [Thioclava sp. JE_KL1]|uniref:siderophore-interacting protein n=1 Tax=Thioclava sp. JE_KL1 TaxID=2651187 RepID=UPI00128E25E5|nr:siderophore-interacting protein [Thioclava sp. JE_KL1]MPQ93347.1 siderophore-interacting protein [Thioclava sp. JE_KL1]